MTIEITVARKRVSVTQGYATVCMNNHPVMTFCDDIELIKKGQNYYGEMIGGWASIKPDMAFIRGCFCHPYDKTYNHHNDILNVLDMIEKESVMSF